MTARVIVVGTGPVGIRFVSELLKNNPLQTIVIFGNEPWQPYNRVKLSSLLAQDVSWESITSHEWQTIKAHPNSNTVIASIARLEKFMQLKMLGMAVNSLNDIPSLVPVIEKLTVDHVSYGVKDEHYDIVGEALIWTLAQGLGDAFTDEVKAAWLETYTLLATTIINATKKIPA